MLDRWRHSFLDRHLLLFLCYRSHPIKSHRAKQATRDPQRVKVNAETRPTDLPKVGLVRTRFHRPLVGRVKNVTVSRDKSGRYDAAFQVEMEIAEPVRCGEGVGMDLGLQHFAVFPDGRKIANARHLIQAERRLRRMQRQLSRKRKGSQGWEDVHVKGLAKNRRSAKSKAAASWGELLRQLASKGGSLVPIQQEMLSVRGREGSDWNAAISVLTGCIAAPAVGTTGSCVGGVYKT